MTREWVVQGSKWLSGKSGQQWGRDRLLEAPVVTSSVNQAGSMSCDKSPHLSINTSRRSHLKNRGNGQIDNPNTSPALTYTFETLTDRKNSIKLLSSLAEDDCSIEVYPEASGGGVC